MPLMINFNPLRHAITKHREKSHEPQRDQLLISMVGADMHRLAIPVFVLGLSAGLMAQAQAAAKEPKASPSHETQA